MEDIYGCLSASTISGIAMSGPDKGEGRSAYFTQDMLCSLSHGLILVGNEFTYAPHSQRSGLD